MIEPLRYGTPAWGREVVEPRGRGRRGLRADMPTVGTDRQFPLVCGDIEAAAGAAGTFFWRCIRNTICAMLLHRSPFGAFGKRHAPWAPGEHRLLGACVVCGAGRTLRRTTPR